jgi:Tfp pilus assembly protein PilX
VKSPKPAARESGVALVTTVIILAVMAVVAVALMQGVTSDRYSARSVANYTRAKLAAEAGLAVASAAIATNSTNDTFIVVLNTNRQLFIGNGVTNPPTSTNFAYVPLFSTVSNFSTPIAAITSGVVPTTNVSGGVVFTNQLPGGLSATSPSITWVYMTNANGATNARFAYWVEDLGGRLDMSVVGTNTAGRPTGTNPAEIALWSVFNPGVSNDIGNAIAGALIGARSNLLTAATARVVNAGVTTNHLADLTANLRHDTNEPEVIPFGFGYADQGRPKYNLNTNISAAGVNTIATIINQNLPQFGSRGGAMASTAYLNNIAASIVDYADADRVPTGDGSTYLGIENIPWPNELFDRITFSGVSTAGLITIQLRDWAEFWNMGNTNTVGTTVSISNNYNMVLTFTNASVGTGVSFQANLNSGNFTAGGLGRRDFNVPSLATNEYRVVPASAPFPRVVTFQIPNASWFSTASIRSAWRLSVRSNDETSNMRFAAFIGTTMIQESKGGRWPRYTASTAPLAPAPSTPSSWVFCNPIGFASQTGSSASVAKPWHSGGDPRAQLFLTGPLRFGNYTNTYASPGGRNWERINLVNFPESEVRPGKFWPDNGHAATNDRGFNPTAATQDPDSASFINAPLATNFVMRRNDSGSLSNVLELGNIFDPMQWGDDTATPAAAQPGLWTNLTTAATNDSRFGGRNTLRVGRWEFSLFTNNGTRASQLLDIFAAGANASGAVTNRVMGRININTASSNTLRALAAGVNNSADQALQPSGTNFVVPVSAVTAFSAGVIDRRTNKPFFSAAELATLSTNAAGSGWPSSSVFGNSNFAGVTDWNDGAAEEWFAKIYPLTTVRSRNFLVHVVGQAVQTNNPTSVLSTARRVFQVYLEPVRGASGLTANSVPRVLATWDL